MQEFFLPGQHHLLFQMQNIMISFRYDFVYLLLFCMVAKYEHVTLARLPDLPHESELLLFTIMVLTFLL